MRGITHFFVGGWACPGCRFKLTKQRPENAKFSVPFPKEVDLTVEFKPFQ
jgi:hypothetical protein